MKRFPKSLNQRPVSRRAGPAWACLSAACLVVAGCESATPPPRPQPAASAVHDHAGHDHDHGAKTLPAKTPPAKEHAGEGHAEAAGHDDHEHPATLAAGLAKLGSTWAAVKTALAAGEHEKADEGVHEVGHLLEDFEALLAKEKPAAEAEAAGKKAIEEIFACFDTLDTAVHEGAEAIKKVDVEALGGRVGEAIKTLEGIAR